MGVAVSKDNKKKAEVQNELHEVNNKLLGLYQRLKSIESSEGTMMSQSDEVKKLTINTLKVQISELEQQKQRLEQALQNPKTYGPPRSGGKTSSQYTKTKDKIQVGNVARCVYVNKRVKYIKMNNQYIKLSDIKKK